MVERAGELLRSLRDLGPRTRTQLAETLGASRSTVNAELVQLVGAGLVQDADGPVSSGGRPSTQVQLHPGLRVLAVSVGETRVRVALVHAGLTIVAGSSLGIEALTQQEVVDRVLESVRALVGEVAQTGRAGAGEATRLPVALGLAVIEAEGSVGLAAGPPDEPPAGPSDGPSAGPPAGPSAGLAEKITDAIVGVLGSPVVVRSTPVRAMARGEGHAGGCRGERDYVVVRLGADITCTSVSGGRLVDGAASAGGRIGHYRIDEFGPACTCGLSGCLDSFAGLAAIVEQARLAGEGGRSAAFASRLQQRGSLDLADVIAAVEAGDRVAVQIARESGRRIGQVLSALVAFANPARIVLGGPGAALGTHLLAEVRAEVHRTAPGISTEHLSIELSRLGERAVLLGAAHAATERLFAG